MGLKKCWVCKTEKEFCQFWKDKQKSDGLQAACIACQKIRNAKYTREHRDYFIAKGKEKYRKEDNAARYEATKENFIRRSSEYRQSVRGRLMNLLNSVKARSKKHGMEFDLNFDWLMGEYEKQAGACLLTGLTFEFKVNEPGKKSFMPFSPSLDRIDCERGYTKNNTRLVCTAVNLALNDFGEDVLEKVCTGFLEKSRNKKVSEK